MFRGEFNKDPPHDSNFILSCWSFCAILFLTRHSCFLKLTPLSDAVVPNVCSAAPQGTRNQFLGNPWTDFCNGYFEVCGSGSVVGIATGYRLDGPGIESRWGARVSAPVQTGPGAHPASFTMGTGSFPGGKERPGRDADPSPPSSAVVKKEYSYTSTPAMGRTACTEPQCLYKGALYLTLTL